MAKLWLLAVATLLSLHFSVCGHFPSDDDERHYHHHQQQQQQQETYPQGLVFCQPNGGRNEVRVKTSRKTKQRPLVLISTLDGRVSAVDTESGELKWSVMTGPGGMLSSSISKIEISSRGQWVRLIPSLEGNLFKFDGNHLEALPVTADSLLSSSLKVADDVIITGGKDNRAYGVDFLTGKLKYICTMTGCQFFGNEVINQDSLLVIRRFTNTVRAVDPMTGLEKWNYSVGQHQLEFIERSSDIICDGERQERKQFNDEEIGDNLIEDAATDKDLDVKILTPQGLVLAFTSDAEKRIVWQQQFGSPVTDAWLVEDGLLKKMNLLEDVSRPSKRVLDDGDDDERADNVASASLYLGIHQQQYYIQQSADMLQKVTEATFHHIYDLQAALPRIQWKPYLVTAVSRTPIVMGNPLPDSFGLVERPRRTDENTALMIRHDSDYPYDGGYYIFPEETPLDTDLFPNNSDPNESFSVDQIIIVSLWYWWREIAGLTILSILLNFFITRFLWKKFKTASKVNPKESIAHIESMERLVANLSVSSDDAVIVSSNLVEFSSRYYNDFDPIQRLGKGGFGVVFQARNKIDDCEYAVKRIYLPNREDAREKVMREVKALAKLDHVGIVRYYNAWLETPPLEWQEKKDRQLEEKGQSSTTCISSEYSTDHPKQTVAIHCKSISELESKISNNNTASFSFNKSSEVESGSFSFDQKDQTKHSEISFRQHSIAEGHLYGGGDTITADRDAGCPLDSLPFGRYHSNSAEGTGDDSFIVFEDSGCADKSASIRNLNSGDDLLDVFAGRLSSVSAKSLPKTKFQEGAIRSRRLSIESEAADFVPPHFPRIQKTYLYIQMQLCRKENLKDWLNSNTASRSKIQVLDFFDQIVSAVEYVHDEGLMHRDLKPSNIFFSVDGSIKVGDFGLVTTMAEGSEDHTPCETVPFKKHTDQVGTQLYMSPEQIMGLSYNHKVDIFSLGLIFFELLIPFKTQMERLQVMLHVKQQNFPDDFLKDQSEECVFVKKLLSHDPEARPSATDIKQHSLLQAFQPRPEVLRHRRTRTLSRTYSTSSSGSLD